jgi:UDP-glucose 4-epimerase
VCGEEYLATYNRLYGTSHVSLRLGNVFGPRQSPHGEAGVVSIFMGLLHEGGTPRIFGDGSQTRDYVFVGDVADALLLALDRDGGAFNIGTGAETSVLELYRAIEAATGITREPQLAPARLGELQRSVLDPSLAARELGWRPGHSLAEGLIATWRWVSEG